MILNFESLVFSKYEGSASGIVCYFECRGLIDFAVDMYSHLIKSSDYK